MARKQFLLRIDPELWKELEKWAADDLRSVNAQVECLLRDAVRLRKGSDRRSDGVADDEVDDDAGDAVGDDAGDAVGDVEPTPAIGLPGAAGSVAR
jgi:hypothetical protein